MSARFILRVMTLVATCAMADRLSHGQAAPVVFVDSLQLADQVERLAGGLVDVRTLGVDQSELDWSSAKSFATVQELRCIITDARRLDAILVERLRHQGLAVIELQPAVGRFEYRATGERLRRLTSSLGDVCEEHREQFEQALALELDLLKHRNKAPLRSAGAGYARNHLDGLAAIRKHL